MFESGIAFGVAAAGSFGAGDFSGGLAARRAGAISVAAGAQLVGLLGLLLVVSVSGGLHVDPGSAALAATAGIGGGIALAALYRGLALGAMGLVTAVSGVGSVAIPVVVGSLLGTSITPWQLLGVGLAVAAGVAASGASRTGADRSSLAMAAIAAVGFGSWFVLLDLAARGDPTTAIVGSRASAAVVMVALAVVRGGIGRLAAPRVAALVIVAGLLDVGGNALFVLSRASVAVGLAAALSGLYPLVTMLLARGVLGEALPRLGILAVALALGGIVLISLG